MAQMSLSMKQNRLTNAENTSVVAKGMWGIGAEVGWSLGLADTNLSREWINNKVLLYSTGNYIQYPGKNNNGKEYKKECVYVCN